MGREGRYQTSHLAEDQCEPSSQGQVLKNRRGITSPEKMARLETELLYELTDQLVDELDQQKRFTADDICQWHHRWLGSVYEWAGQYRQVMISKGGFPFAAPAHIPRLMADFEQNCLAQYTPCNFPSKEKITTALATTHVELVLIHPFREGNGRIARLLATLMALQAGLPFLDFSILAGNCQQKYFAAVQMGLERHYDAMEKIFAEIIRRSLEKFGK